LSGGHLASVTGELTVNIITENLVVPCLLHLP
jgi:hypothetical protein